MKIRAYIYIISLVLLNVNTMQSVHAQDAGIFDIISPDKSIILELDSSYSVEVVIKNYADSLDTLTTIPLFFQVGDHNFVLHDTFVGILIPQDTVHFKFKYKTIIIDTSSYIVQAKTTLSNDINPYNDAYITYYTSSEDLNKELSYSISIYPNPVADLLKIELYEKDAIAIEIYNLPGTLINRIPYFGQKQIQIDVSTLATGIYILNIYSETHSSTRKFIVK